jgi:hypothetical protein
MTATPSREAGLGYMAPRLLGCPPIGSAWGCSSEPRQLAHLEASAGVPVSLLLDITTTDLHPPVAPFDPTSACGERHPDGVTTRMHHSGMPAANGIDR